MKTVHEIEEDARVDCLNDVIDGIYGEPPRHDLQYVQTRMLEVEQLDGDGRGALVDIYEDKGFSPVCFHPQVYPLLRLRDIFLATIGWNETHWEVFHLGPVHEEAVSEDFEYDA